jgi:hypothetical protein
MRYTAVTGDPDDFDKEFDLRQVSAYSPRRQTELFIVSGRCVESS